MEDFFRDTREFYFGVDDTVFMVPSANLNRAPKLASATRKT